jgi:hypothetical protein
VSNMMAVKFINFHAIKRNVLCNSIIRKTQAISNVGIIKLLCILTNVVAEWLTLLLHIWEVPGSNICLETGYPD